MTIPIEVGSINMTTKPTEYWIEFQDPEKIEAILNKGTSYQDGLTCGEITDYWTCRDLSTFDEALSQADELKEKGIFARIFHRNCLQFKKPHWEWSNIMIWEDGIALRKRG